MKDNINIINKFNSDGILVVDFGSQYTQLIARRVREEGVFCQIIPFNRVENYLLENEPNGIILSGGPESVLDNSLGYLNCKQLYYNFNIVKYGSEAGPTTIFWKSQRR